MNRICCNYCVYMFCVYMFCDKELLTPFSNSICPKKKLIKNGVDTRPLPPLGQYQFCGSKFKKNYESIWYRLSTAYLQSLILIIDVLDGEGGGKIKIYTY